MQFTGIGDLAQNLMLRRQGAGLKTQMTRLTQELTTGKSQNTSARVQGDFGPLASIEHQLGKLEAFQHVRDGFGNKMLAVQSSLEAIQTTTEGFGADLVSAASLEQLESLEARSANARGHLDQVISYMNAQFDGQFLFSGAVSDQAPLMTADDMLTQLGVVAATATDAADLVAKIDSWFFDPGGAFETAAYQGGVVPAETLQISDEAGVEQPILANDDGFRVLLRGLALTALVADGSAPVGVSEHPALLSSAGQSVIEGQNALTGLQRDIGSVQAALSREDTAATAERVAYEDAKATITSVDPYEAAAELEAVQFQIETLYVLTARMSQLRLSDYLR